MTLIELKAAAYDIIGQIEYFQKQLQETNAKIAEELQKEKNENG
jgi:hypothetical protein